MTLQQLRYLCEVVDSNLSISRAAEALHVSQPGISRIIRQLEEELAVDILVRKGHRISGITEEGETVVQQARMIMSIVREMRDVASDRNTRDHGQLNVATTHQQARYALLSTIQEFAREHPGVSLHFVQGSTTEIINWVSEGRMDLGIAAIPGKLPDNVVALDAYDIEHCVIAPLGHPLLAMRKPGIRDIARFPLVVYHESSNGGRVTLREFRKHNLQPKIAMKATDAGVIKAYVAAGLGVAVIQTVAVDPGTDSGIRIVPNAHEFPSSMTSVILRKGRYLRGYAYDLLQAISGSLDRKTVLGAIGR
ncbi:MAG: LysR family transcriptional regulator [Burkholderiales bacterium]|nr:LysR family transcriptional regulator [Burkholderiales bacterium]